MEKLDKKDWLFIITILLFIILFRYCKNSEPKPYINNPINDTIAKDNLDLRIALANNKDLRIANDSLAKLPPIYRTKYKTFYDTIYKEAPDTCHYYLAQLNHKCMVLDSINEATISSYAGVLQSDLQVFAKYEKLNKSRITKSVIDSLTIDSLTHSKKKYFKGFRHGFITGVIVSGAVNVGSKFVK